MNAKMVWLLRGAPQYYPHKLEGHYPRILERIVEQWGTTQMRRTFDELMIDERGGREGFPPDVISEIFNLSHYYEQLNPSKSKLEKEWHDYAQADRLERLERLDRKE
jgi:hypothetical protein